MDTVGFAGAGPSHDKPKAGGSAFSSVVYSGGCGCGCAERGAGAKCRDAAAAPGPGDADPVLDTAWLGSWQGCRPSCTESSCEGFLRSSVAKARGKGNYVVENFEMLALEDPFTTLPFEYDAVTASFAAAPGARVHLVFYALDAGCGIESATSSLTFSPTRAGLPPARATVGADMRLGFLYAKKGYESVRDWRQEVSLKRVRE